MSDDDTEKKKSPSDVPPLDETTAPADEAEPYFGVDGPSAQEEYLYGRNVLSDYNAKPNWASSTQGRMAIRTISRGIFGALSFAFATRYASNQLFGYDPSTFIWGKEKFIGKGSKPLQYVANVFDHVAGKPIETVAKWMNPEWAKTVTRFRPTNYYHNVAGMQMGRSLGAEVVAVTYDFAAMSLGDGAVRNMIQAFDPNLPQPWWIDKNGNATTRDKGHFDFGKWAHAVGRASWRVVTKNAGEDWAAALPYVYQLRWQRNMLSKFVPTFAYSSDRNRNGGSYIVNDKGDIVGDHQLVGLLDLQGRFVGYNVFTLMYREIYDGIGRRLYHAYKHGVSFDFHIPSNPIASVIDGLSTIGRYLIKSTIKANLFMQPSVPFFWITRTPQSKWRSEFILENAQPGQSSVGTWDSHPKGLLQGGTAGSQAYGSVSKTNRGLRPTGGLHNGARPDFIHFSDQKVPFPKSLKEKGLFSWENSPSLTSKLLSPFGWMCFTLGSGLNHAIDAVLPVGSRLSKIMAGPGGTPELWRREDFLRTYVDAAMSYTPYFIAKDEFGLRVNDSPSTGENGRMDKAIYGLIDNLSSWQLGKAGKSVKEIGGLAIDLQSKPAKYFEGRKIVKDEDDDKPKKPAAAPGTPKTTIVLNPKIDMTPSTKVQATTVQYNGPPPMHVRHTTPEETAQNQGWADSVGDRKHADVQLPGNSTIH